MCTKCTNGGCGFVLNLHAAKLGQMKGGSQMHVVTACLQGIAEELVGRLRVVLRRRAAQSQKISTACFAAVVGDGKGQLYIFLIGWSNVCSCISDCFGQKVQ